MPQSRRVPRSTIPNKRLYHNLATIKAPVDIAEKLSKPNWQLVVDKATGMKCSAFHKNKDDIPDDTSAQLKATERLAGKDIQVWRITLERIRCLSGI